MGLFGFGSKTPLSDKHTREAKESYTSYGEARRIMELVFRDLSNLMEANEDCEKCVTHKCLNLTDDKDSYWLLKGQYSSPTANMLFREFQNNWEIECEGYACISNRWFDNWKRSYLG